MNNIRNENGDIIVILQIITKEVNKIMLRKFKILIKYIFLKYKPPKTTHEEILKKENTIKIEEIKIIDPQMKVTSSQESFSQHPKNR